MSSFELPLKACLAVSSFEQNLLFVCLSVGQHHFIISFFYKRNISVPCFMVTVIHKATAWLFQEKNAFLPMKLRCRSSFKTQDSSCPVLVSLSRKLH